MSQDLEATLVDHVTREDILAHPRFGESRRSYVDEVLALYENDPFMSRLLMEAARVVLFLNAICLHFAQDPDDSATWPTLGLLQRTLAPYGVASPRRIEDLMGRLVRTGYFRSEPTPADRRMRVLVPTERALAHDRDWLAVHFAPLVAMYPVPGYRLPRARDSGFQAAQRRIGMALTERSTAVLATNAPVMMFMARDCGLMVLMKLVQLAEANEDRTSCRISFAELARAFGTSRTHVRYVLRDAEEAGLLALDDGRIALSPELLGAFDRFVADCMDNHDLTHRLTLAALARATDEAPAA